MKSVEKGATMLVLLLLTVLASSPASAAAPTFQAAGTSQNGTGAVSPAWPAHADRWPSTSRPAGRSSYRGIDCVGVRLES